MADPSVRLAELERRLFECAQCALIALDETSRVHVANAAARQWFGLDQTDGDAPRFIEFVDPPERETCEAWLASLGDAHPEGEFDARLVCADGSVRTRRVKAAFVAGCDSHAPAILLSLTSLTPDEVDHRKLMRVDATTGLPNAQGFEEQAARELSRCRRTSSPLSLLILNVDQFPQVLATQGRAAGEHLLRGVSDMLRETLRKTDLPARLDEETLAVLMPDTPTQRALEVAERLRQLLSAASAGAPEGGASRTVSIGVSSLAASDTGIEALIARSRGAHEDAEREGGDQVRFDPSGG